MAFGCEWSEGKADMWIGNPKKRGVGKVVALGDLKRKTELPKNPLGEKNDQKSGTCIRQWEEGLPTLGEEWGERQKKGGSILVQRGATKKKQLIAPQDYLKSRRGGRVVTAFENCLGGKNGLKIKFKWVGYDLRLTWIKKRGDQASRKGGKLYKGQLPWEEVEWRGKGGGKEALPLKLG